MTAPLERAAACGAAERPTGVLSLRAALALCGEAIEPSLDLGDAKAIKPQSADSGLDVVLHVARRSAAKHQSRRSQVPTGISPEISVPGMGRKIIRHAARSSP
jgi:hypothetical protein